MDKGAWVYLLTNKSDDVFYIGVTSDIERRMAEHKSHRIPGFTQRYNVDKLVYLEEHCSIKDAIAREKQLKGWCRSKKKALVDAVNPSWHDLASG